MTLVERYRKAWYMGEVKLEYGKGEVENVQGYG